MNVTVSHHCFTDGPYVCWPPKIGDNRSMTVDVIIFIYMGTFTSNIPFQECVPICADYQKYSVFHYRFEDDAHDLNLSLKSHVFI